MLLESVLVSNEKEIVNMWSVIQSGCVAGKTHTRTPLSLACMSAAVECVYLYVCMSVCVSLYYCTIFKSILMFQVSLYLYHFFIMLHTYMCVRVCV